jgi:hypothetical protein
VAVQDAHKRPVFGTVALTVDRPYPLHGGLYGRGSTADSLALSGLGELKIVKAAACRTQPGIRRVVSQTVRKKMQPSYRN